MTRVLKPDDEAVDIDSGFRRSVRPAAGLAPVATTAPRSVFDMAGPQSDEPAATETAPRSLACAIFNTGELLIEVPERPALRLSSAHAGELIQYLRTVQEGMK